MFAKALHDSRIPVILAVFHQGVRRKDGTMQVLESQPIQPFLGNADLAAFDVRPDDDGMVRRLFTREQWSDRIMPHYAALIAGRQGADFTSYHVNFAINPNTIPHVSFADVLAGRVDPSIFKGRDVLIGASAVQLGDMVTVPVYRSLPGITLQALGYSSLALGVTVTRLGPGPMIAILAVILLLMELLRMAGYWRNGLLIGACTSGLAIFAGWFIQDRYFVAIDTAPILLLTVVDFLAGLLSRIRKQDLRLLVQTITLRRRDMFMRLIVENSFDAVLTLDATGEIISCNRAAEEIFMRSRKEMTGENIVRLLPNATISGTTQDDADLLSLRGMQEISCDGPSGALLLLDLSISQVRTEDQFAIIWLARDITEKRQAEAHARAAQDRLLESIESVQEGIALFDADDRLMVSNRKYREKGRDVRQPHGETMRYSEIIGALADSGYFDSARDDPNAWVTARLEQHRNPTGAMIDRTSDGKWILTSERRTDDGGTIVVETDITTLKEREEELVQAKDAAEQASRAKSEFLAAMSHELRTPLNAIIGFSEMIGLEVYGPLGSGQYKEYISDIHSSGKHLLDIINGILDMAKIESGNFKLDEAEFDLAESIGAAVRLTRESAIRKDLELETDIAASPVVIVADQRLIRQIILNLLSNAIKFTPEGGRIAVRLANARDGGARIAVEDTGIGMSAEDMVKALETFGQVESSLSRNYEGTGLGLPLAKRFVELHGGRLRIESSPGAGTRVSVHLPAERLRDATMTPSAVTRASAS